MMDIVGIDRREMIWKVGLNLDLVLDLLWNLYVSENNLLGFFFCFLVRVKMFNREDFICLG